MLQAEPYHQQYHAALTHPDTLDGRQTQDRRRILPMAGIRYRNPYQTRHTYASSLLMLAATSFHVTTQLGHVGTV